MMPKDYLGDAVYAEVDLYVGGYELTLTTWNGIEDTNTIVLEPSVVDALKRYMARADEVRTEVLERLKEE